MSNPRPWTVAPHEPLTQIDDNLWAVAGRVPGAPIPRRMTIIRRSDGALVLHDSFAVDDKTLEAIRALGTPTYQIVAHAQHMIEAPAVREKLGLKTFCPAASLAKVRARMPVDGTLDELPADPALTIRPSEGLKTGEAWLLVHSGPRTSLVTADTVMWMKEGTFVTRLMGFIGPEPKVAPPLFKLVALGDKKRFRASFERFLDETKDLARIVPCHGGIIDEDPIGRVRRAIAASL